MTQERKTKIITGSITDLVDQLLEEAYTPLERSVERIDFFMQSSRNGAAGLEGLLLLEQIRANPSLVWKKEAIERSDETLLDTGLFCAYMMLAQQRALVTKPRQQLTIADCMTKALELFALYEDRAYPRLLEIERLIHRRNPPKESKAT